VPNLRKRLALQWRHTLNYDTGMSKTQSSMLELGTVAPAFELTDVVSGRAVGRDDVVASADGGGLLVMFLCVHCPYVKHVEQELARIGADYEGKIATVAISANDVAAFPEDSPAEMKKQAERLRFKFPYLYDETQEVARSYNAACTPDFFLFDAEMKLVYRGQLDDSRPQRSSGGGNDIPVTGRDLRAGMDAVVAGKRPDTNQRSSIGCNIKWRE
jgi:thiol-disulfide isomerase/thioredoxin